LGLGVPLSPGVSLAFLHIWWRFSLGALLATCSRIEACGRGQLIPTAVRAWSIAGSSDGIRYCRIGIDRLRGA